MYDDMLKRNPQYEPYIKNNINPFKEKLLDHMPLETFFVTSGKRYRFRLMSPGFIVMPIRFTIDNHTLEVIYSDTGPVTPKRVKSIVIFPGERYVKIDCNLSSSILIFRFCNLL
jgi:FtsP/CotA-like multicopper oxidase with cupredoxin domain